MHIVLWVKHTILCRFNGNIALAQKQRFEANLHEFKLQFIRVLGNEMNKSLKQIKLLIELYLLSFYIK